MLKIVSIHFTQGARINAVSQALCPRTARTKMLFELLTLRQVVLGCMLSFILTVHILHTIFITSIKNDIYTLKSQNFFQNDYYLPK